MPGRLLLIPSLSLLLAACGQGTPPPAAAGPRPWAAYLNPAARPLSLEEETLQDLAARADWLANRPEVQEPEAVEALYENWQEPTFLAETEAPYYDPESPATPPDGSGTELQALMIACDDPYALDCDPSPAPAPTPTPPVVSSSLEYMKIVAWGSVDGYNQEYANRWNLSGRYGPFPSMVDWDRNGCSVPDWSAITGVGSILWLYRNRFEPACNVHDFGYRNLPRIEPGNGNRQRTDDVFLGNMRNICHHRPWYQRPTCRMAAWSYHKFVRGFGWWFWDGWHVS